MPNGSSGPLWAELSNIDYLLEQLARAVERGEVGRDVYDRLAPRYLERRADIVVALTPRSQAPVHAAPEATLSRPGVPVHETGGVPETGTTVPYGSLTSPPVQQPRAATPATVNWTGVLTGVGSLLVIVASAIFAIATWDLFSVEFKIAFLGALTAGFYGVGALVRTRLELDVGGIALTAVGSAMLLFDGWIVIDGYGLNGAWPWVAWLTVCSAVYWVTEVRIAGRFFGAVGAAAQIAWVWLLGQGLGWSTPPRMAAIAVIGLVWTFVGRATSDRRGLASLAFVLRWAGPIAVGFALVGVTVDLGLAPAGWTEVVSALVVGTAATVIAEARGWNSGIAALAHAPALLAIASMVGYTGATWWHVALLAAMTAAYLLHELVCGGWGHGIAAVVSELAAWFLVADLLDLPDDGGVALFAGVGLAYVIAGRMIGSSQERDTQPGWRNTSAVVTVAGYAVLAGTTVLVPAVRGAVPLAGAIIEPRDVALAAFLTIAWAITAAARPEPGAGVFALAGVVWTTAGLLAWLAPGLHSATYATALVAVAGVVMLARAPLGRVLRLPEMFISVAMRALAAAAVVLGVAASEYFFDARSWQVGMVLATGAAFWVLSAVLAEERQWGLAVASAHLVTSASVLAWWQGSPAADSGAIAVAATGVAVGVVLSAVFVRTAGGWRDAWPLGALAASTLLATTALGHPGPLAVALVLAALGWAIAAYLVEPAFAAIAGVAALLAALSWCAWVDTSGWVTVTAMLSGAALLLAPSMLLAGGLTPVVERGVQALAAAGFVGPLVLLVIDGSRWLFAERASWVDIGEQGLVAALVGLAAYSASVGLLHRAEPLVLGGGAVLVLALWAEWSALDVESVEAFTTPAGLYVAWLGSRWARTRGEMPPVAGDAIATAIILAPATLAAIGSGPASEAWPHIVWALGLALSATALGVVLRVRAYFFGGAAALVLLALGRSWTYLVAFWWLVLGLIGIVMLIVALTWERQRLVLRATSERVEEAFDSWR